MTPQMSYELISWLHRECDATIIKEQQISKVTPSDVLWDRPFKDWIPNHIVTEKVLTIEIPENQLIHLAKTLQQLETEEQMRRVYSDLNEQYQSYKAMLGLLYSLTYPQKTY